MRASSLVTTSRCTSRPGWCAAPSADDQFLAAHASAGWLSNCMMPGKESVAPARRGSSVGERTGGCVTLTGAQGGGRPPETLYSRSGLVKGAPVRATGRCDLDRPLQRDRALATPAAKRREPERGLRLSVRLLGGAPPLRQWYRSRGAELPARVHDDHVIVTSHGPDRSVQRGRGIGGRRRISQDCRRASGTRAHGRARWTHEELVPEAERWQP